MVRRVLSVLALLPLLLPPGLCVCHAPTAACTAGTARRADGCHAPLAHLCLAHDCDGGRHNEPASSGGPHQHIPGCPALRGVDHWAAKPGTVVQVMALDLACPGVPLNARACPPAATRLLPRLDPVDESPPLYLSLRTLLI